MPRFGCPPLTVASAAAVLMIVLGWGGLGCSDPDGLEDARQLQAAGRLEESLEPLRGLLTSTEHSAEIHYRYGMALARTGLPGVSIWSLRKAQEDPEWEARASLELARSSLISHNWVNAIEAAGRVLEAEPDNLDALDFRAEAYLGQMTHPHLALEDLEHAIDLAPEATRFKTSRARALIMTDQIDEATEAITELEDIYRNASTAEKRVLGPVCALRVVFNREKGETAKSDEELLECLETHPADGTVINTAIDIYDRKGEYQRATDVIRNALERAPTSLRYRTLLAARLTGMGRAEEAESLLREALEMDTPRMAESTWVALSQHFAETGDVAAAADAYGQAIQLSPEVSERGWLTYADLLAGAERNDEALEAAKHLKAEHYRNLIESRVRLNQGDAQKALELLDKVLPLWPNNAGARYFAARAAEQQGLFERAVEEYRQSVRSDAAATDAGLRLARLLWALGDRQSAWVVCHHHVLAQPGDRDGNLFMVRMALVRGGGSLSNQLKQVSETAHWPAAIELYLDGVAEISGPEAAFERLRLLSLDLTQSWNADALRSAVRQMIAAGDPAAARIAVKAALDAHPEDAAFHAVAGLELELLSGDPADGQAEYERAIGLDGNEAHALESLGRVAAAGGREDDALAYFDRAAAANPSEPEVQIRAARLVAKLAPSQATPQPGEAISPAPASKARWLAVAREFPWLIEPQLQLARIELAGQPSNHALDLTQRAVRLGGGSPAWTLLVEIHQQRGETELADKARKQIQMQLKARRAKVPEPQEAQPSAS